MTIASAFFLAAALTPGWDSINPDRKEFPPQKVLWRADLDEEAGALVYGMDLFSKRGGLWERRREEHVEHVHAPETLRRLLEDAGFAEIRLRTDFPQADGGRLFITAKRKDS